jgi:signal transduction histidine kinase
MLYVGYLEQPFRYVKYGMLALIVAIFMIVMVLAALFSVRWARSIFRPLEQMNQTMQRVEDGDASARVGPVTARDEIGALASHFDQLLDVIDEKTRALQRWAGELDAKVIERTRELAQSNASLQQAQQQLVKSEKLAAIGQLTASVAHEINNPIAVIAGIAEAIGEKRIAEQARRVAAITRQIADMSSPQPAERQLLDLNGLVENACAFARYDRRLRKVNVELDLDRRLPAVHAVGDHLTQVLMNLLTNAGDAIAEAGVAGRIRVATRREGAAVLLIVSDNGAGMDERVRARAFDEFFTTKPQGKGCGIGLALSRRLLCESGGDIALESQPGQGTCAAVRLPA